MKSSSYSLGIAPELAPELDLLCFSHLHWSFVTQRPQHLLRHAAANRRVFYWEEPFHHAPEQFPTGVNLLETAASAGTNRCALEFIPEGSVTVLRPHLLHGVTPEQAAAAQASLLQAFVRQWGVSQCIAWYYTPMALAFTGALRPSVTVYDCMDELSLFHGAPPELRQREAELLRSADVVFTGGYSLFEAKRTEHGNVHAFPSSIDRAHFQPRSAAFLDSADQAAIPHPRAGFYGVIDERLDTALVGQVAQLLPEVHFVLLGPVVKIDPATLPAAPNLHYLGGKSYNDLPSYLAGWDVALLPFARNDATRFISPTKTPEYLAAGKPVVSTPIRDVVRGYGDAGLVAIAETAQEFAAAIQKALAPPTAEWRAAVEQKLGQTSWQQTWSEMAAVIALAIASKKHPEKLSSKTHSEKPAGKALSEAAAAKPHLEKPAGSLPVAPRLKQPSYLLAAATYAKPGPEHSLDS